MGQPLHERALVVDAFPWEEPVIGGRITRDDPAYRAHYGVTGRCEGPITRERSGRVGRL
jgi:hypothetical protein